MNCLYVYCNHILLQYAVRNHILLQYAVRNHILLQYAVRNHILLQHAVRNHILLQYAASGGNNATNILMFTQVFIHEIDLWYGHLTFVE